MDCPCLTAPKVRNNNATEADHARWLQEWDKYAARTGRTRWHVLADLSVKPEAAHSLQRVSRPKEPPVTLKACYFRCSDCAPYRDIHPGGRLSADKHSKSHSVAPVFEFFALGDHLVDPDITRNKRTIVIGEEREA